MNETFMKEKPVLPLLLTELLQQEHLSPSSLPALLVSLKCLESQNTPHSAL